MTNRLLKLLAMKGLKGGGGGAIETVLWINSSPASEFANSGTLNLSDSIENYDYIKIQFRSTVTGTGDPLAIIASPRTLKSLNPSVGYAVPCMGFVIDRVISRVAYRRYICYVNSTTLHHSTSDTDLEVLGSSTYIPIISVIGIK